MDRVSFRPPTFIFGAIAALALMPLASLTAQAQATSRACAGTAGETPGAACLAAHQDIGALPARPLYWTLYTFATVEAAERARPPRGAVVPAFGRVWLFDVGNKGGDLPGGRHVADVGPLPVDAAPGNFSVEYLKSTFTPGMSAPLHVHSGPEAFYALGGGTCLETPDGAQVGRGEGHSLMVRRGLPMLLQAIGNEPRQGFALILHEAASPPTTLTSHLAAQGAVHQGVTGGGPRAG